MEEARTKADRELEASRAQLTDLQVAFATLKGENVDFIEALRKAKISSASALQDVERARKAADNKLADAKEELLLQDEKVPIHLYTY
jgi:hypothetical protein